MVERYNQGFGKFGPMEHLNNKIKLYQIGFLTLSVALICVLVKTFS